MKKSGNKSMAKAMGLKSTFVLDDSKLYITSFAKGNAAQHEKNVIGNEVENIRETFDVTVIDDAKFDVSKEKMKTVTVNIEDANKRNQLHAKETVEKQFFNKTFTDNIHIQLAYNIMDIKKILNHYSNYAIEAINSWVKRDNDCDRNDFLGMFATYNSFKYAPLAKSIIQTKLINREKSNNNFSYVFDTAVWKEEQNKRLKPLNEAVNEYIQKNNLNNKFWSNLSDFLKDECGWKNKETGNSQFSYIEKASKDYAACEKMLKSSVYFSDSFVNNEGDFDSQRCYNLIKILGNIRQGSFHHNQDSIWLYNLNKNIAKEDSSLLETLNEVFDKRIEKINNEFIKKNKVNLDFLFKTYGSKAKEEIIKDYYNFLIKKDFQNLGFSIKTLREVILKIDDAKYIADDKYSTIRNKIYNLLDYIIYDYYQSNPLEINSFVEELRETFNDEMKELVYKTKAETVWKNIKDLFKNNIINSENDCKKIVNIINEIQNDNTNNIEELNGCFSKIAVDCDSILYFSKVIYCMSLFLDGKEINQFITSLINKFDNIASFITVLKNIENNSDKASGLIDKYAFFNDSERIVEELKLVKSISKMNKGVKTKKNQSAKVKECHYFDAAAVLGETDREKVKRLFELEKKSPKANHKLRNFFINSVIVSKNFNYIVRFINPKDAKPIMQTESLVKYVMFNQISDDQIKKYYKRVIDASDFGPDDKNLNVMRHELIKEIQKISFDKFECIKKSPSNDIEKYSGLITLYLLILYLIVKSLVRVNTYYSLAISILERDCEIMNQKYESRDFYVKKSENKKTILYNAKCITEKFKEENYINSRISRTLDENESLYTEERFNIYRNIIAHLNVISKLPELCEEKKITKMWSYFDLYHYIIYMLMIEKDEDLKNIPCNNELTLFENEQKYNNAPRNLVYALNTPFAYNGARYMNLSSYKCFEESFGK